MDRAQRRYVDTANIDNNIPLQMEWVHPNDHLIGNLNGIEVMVEMRKGWGMEKGRSGGDGMDCHGSSCEFAKMDWYFGYGPDGLGVGNKGLMMKHPMFPPHCTEQRSNTIYTRIKEPDICP